MGHFSQFAQVLSDRGLGYVDISSVSYRGYPEPSPRADGSPCIGIKKSEIFLLNDRPGETKAHGGLPISRPESLRSGARCERHQRRGLAAGQRAEQGVRGVCVCVCKLYNVSGNLHNGSNISIPLATYLILSQSSNI